MIVTHSAVLQIRDFLPTGAYFDFSCGAAAPLYYESAISCQQAHILTLFAAQPPRCITNPRFIANRRIFWLWLRRSHPLHLCAFVLLIFRFLLFCEDFALFKQCLNRQG